jgi:capsular polysaccharide biosynthesis protein
MLTEYQEVVDGAEFRYRTSGGYVRLERKTDAGRWLDSARIFASFAEARNWVYRHFRMLRQGKLDE